MSKKQSQILEEKKLFEINELIKFRKEKKLDINYIAIDPGIQNVGWCLINFETSQVSDVGNIKHKKEEDKFGNDVRFYKIKNDIEKLMINYKPCFVVIEKISFTLGYNSYSESIFLKAIGLIHCTIACEFIPIIEITNKKAQQLLLGKAATKSNKEQIKEFIKQQIDKKIIKNKNILLKQFDVSDAIMIGLAFKIAHDICFNIEK